MWGTRVCWIIISRPSLRRLRIEAMDIPNGRRPVATFIAWVNYPLVQRLLTYVRIGWGQSLGYYLLLNRTICMGFQAIRLCSFNKPHSKRHDLRSRIGDLLTERPRSLSMFLESRLFTSTLQVVPVDNPRNHMFQSSTQWNSRKCYNGRERTNSNYGIDCNRDCLNLDWGHAREVVDHPTQWTSWD